MSSGIDLGAYYRCSLLGLVKTVARAYDNKSGESVIVYAPIKNNGYVDDLFFMEEKEFTNTLKI